MPRRAFLADVELLSSKAASDTHPHIIKVSFDSDNDVVSVTFEYSGLAEPIVLGILCGETIPF
ncbi:hypothetical protein SCUCBS95973_005300 [Sporothrix curviconia]|uniref:Uncharacterized protein n=1 Tax=Sporothrix curviconia TaxID=1260050 RepID=A0ABP0BVW9_9PEZI